MENQFELVNWLPKDESLINRCIRSFMEILVINSDGEAKTTEWYKLELLLNILIHLIQLKEISSEEDKWHLLYRTLFKLKMLKEQNPYKFKQLLTDEVRNFWDKPLLNYVVLFPLNITPDSISKFRSINTLGIKMYIRSWRYVKKHFSYDDFVEKGNATLILKNTNLDDIQLERRFTPIIAYSCGRYIFEVFNRTERVFDIFRTHLNMIYKLFRFSYQYGGYPKPMGIVLPPPLYGIFTPDGKFESLYYNTTIYQEYKENAIPYKDFKFVRKIALKLGNPQSEEDTKNLLISAIEIYGQVLDTTEWQLAFLYLWQMLELLTLKTEKVTEKQVINRVRAIIKLSEYQNDLLEVIYDKRNVLVHTGKFPQNNTTAMKDVGLLKTIAESLILEYYELTRTYTSIEDLKNYMGTLGKR